MRIDRDFPRLLLSYPVYQGSAVIILNINIDITRSSIFFFFLEETIQAYLENISGLIPDHHNKENIEINQVKSIFRFPVHANIVFTLHGSLLSVQYLFVKKKCIYLNLKFFIHKKC